ncbi:hypothetical protein SDC9_166748 [bioreactor metagenome]|uniref:Uncharacterized protein n=1 Tax=bioreactor metagenome TaxID=1076179 RepID=A0A645G0I6_9ZZZZ
MLYGLLPCRNRIIRKEIEHRLIDAANLSLIDRNADQQRKHALAYGKHMRGMLRRVAVEIPFVERFAVLLHEKSCNVAILLANVRFECLNFTLRHNVRFSLFCCQGRPQDRA